MDCQQLLIQGPVILPNLDRTSEDHIEFVCPGTLLKDHFACFIFFFLTHVTYFLNLLCAGGLEEIDLSEDDADPENSANTTNYEAAAQHLADQGDRIFTGPMKGGLWNGRCMDASAMSRSQGEKAAYELLLRFGDQYVSSLPADQQRRWQGIKDHAASLLKANPKNAGENVTGNGGKHA